MGVVVPQIESRKEKKSLDERGYGLLGSSARIDEAADAYEELLEKVILAAEVETAMKKMLTEIETTKRRVNALKSPPSPLVREPGVHRAEARRAGARGDLPAEEDQGEKGRRGEGRGGAAEAVEDPEPAD